MLGELGVLVSVGWALHGFRLNAEDRLLHVLKIAMDLRLGRIKLLFSAI